MADPRPAGSESGHPPAAAPGDPGHLPTAADIRTDLGRRTQEILEAPRGAEDPPAREREKAVVHECRYLMRLLAMRRRSEGEMRTRLARREVPADIVHEVMARIDRAGLIDDGAFARDWVAQRRTLRSLGEEALRRELADRAVDPAHIDAALSAGQSDEESRCRDLVRSRIGPRDQERLRTDHDGSHRRRLSRRLDALLTRKGYPGSLAVHIISAELREAAGPAMR